MDADSLGKSADDVVAELRSGKPSIWVREDKVEDSFIVRVPLLREGGETIIAARLREILEDAAP